MLKNILVRAAAALLAAAAGAGCAAAQNYDGSGVVKFGFYGQGTRLDVDVKQPFIGSVSPDGFTGGLSAGYDQIFGRRWLLGAEIDGSFGDTRGSVGGTDFGFDYLLALKGRLGVFAHPNWLLYGNVGVGFLGMEIQQPGVGNKSAETLTGIVAGAGTEVDWHHVILFGEYLYGSYDDRNFSISNVRHDIKVESHMLRLGMKFKVGHDYAHDTDAYDTYKRRDTLK